MKIRILTLLAICLASISITSAQEIQDYDVEVVLFRYATPALGNERWPAQVLSANTANSIDLAQTPATRRGAMKAQTLAPATFRLQGKADAIARSNNYQLLVHTAWRQSGLDDSQTIALRFKAQSFERPIQEQLRHPWIFENLGPSKNSIQPAIPLGETTDNQLTLTEEPVNIELTRPAEYSELVAPTELKYVNYALDGTIKIVRSRYLHVYTDLVYTLPLAEVASNIEMPQVDQFTPTATAAVFDAIQMQSFQIRNHRRMRSKELHHIDHPIVGMLVLITPANEDD